jgi:hypothetical protein
VEEFIERNFKEIIGSNLFEFLEQDFGSVKNFLTGKKL